MGVWAHPDDETFTSAGIMAAASRNGQKVICVTATKGELGTSNTRHWPAHKLADARKNELEQGLKILGVTKHVFLDYKDGKCNAVHQDAVLCLCDLIKKHKPDTILTFGFDGMTGHPDHQAVCMWAVRAKATLKNNMRIYHAVQTPEQYQKMLILHKKLNIFYNIDEPKLCKQDSCDIYLKLDSELTNLKLRALKAMATQSAKMFQHFSKDVLADAFEVEAFSLEG